MATRGIKQLQKIRFAYCEHGGSSSSIREFLSSEKIIAFAEKNPSVEVIVKPRNGKHPHINGSYITGLDKQICIKNEPLERIEKVLTMLCNSSGRKRTKLQGPIRTDTPTVQGVWTPMLNINQRQFKIEIVED